MIHLDVLNPFEEALNKLTLKGDRDKTGKYTISGETNLYSIVINLASNYPRIFSRRHTSNP
jgi:hypothetical protein